MRQLATANGLTVEERDLVKQPFTAEEAGALIGTRDHLPFLNTRNEVYRSQNLKEKPPTRQAALALLAQNPNLLRRPVLVAGSELHLGFDEEVYRRVLKKG